MNRPLPIKLVLVGDKRVGKTSLLLQFIKGKYSEEQLDPDSMETLAKVVTVDDRKYNVTVVDTNGAQTHDRIRPLSYYYPPVDVFLFCYDATDRKTFDNVATKWILETKKHCPTAKLFVVGTKADKAEKSPGAVTPSDGEKLACSINARGSLQVSSPSGRNVIKLFHTVISLGAEKYLNYQTFSSTTPMGAPAHPESTQRQSSTKKSTKVA